MTSTLAPATGARPRTPADDDHPASNTARHALAAVAARGARARGVWEMGECLVFVDCDRHPHAPPADATAPRDAAGCHHFVLRADAAPAGPPGASSVDRAMQVTMSACYLAARATRQGRDMAPPGAGRAVQADLGIGWLVGAHHAGVDQGLSGRQPYFDTLRLGIEDRLVSLSLRQRDGAEPEPESMAPSRARRATDYVENHIGGDLRLDLLAAAAGMSKFHFSRAFRNTFGLSPHAFVMHRRLGRALELLRGRLPVGEVASRCGFSDHAHLTRQFKRAFGVPPSALGRARDAASPA